MTAYRHNLTIQQIRQMQKEQSSEGKLRLVRIDLSKEQDHEDPLTSVFVDPNSGKFITADSDGLVKIWTNDKQIIREVTFPEPIKSVMFINANCDVLIGHGKFVSMVHLKDYNVKL